MICRQPEAGGWFSRLSLSFRILCGAALSQELALHLWVDTEDMRRVAPVPPCSQPNGLLPCLLTPCAGAGAAACSGRAGAGGRQGGWSSRGSGALAGPRDRPAQAGGALADLDMVADRFGCVLPVVGEAASAAGWQGCAPACASSWVFCTFAMHDCCIAPVLALCRLPAVPSAPSPRTTLAPPNHTTPLLPPRS